MSCKDRLEEYLRDNGVPFQVQHHARVFTAQEAAGPSTSPASSWPRWSWRSLTASR